MRRVFILALAACLGIGPVAARAGVDEDVGGVAPVQPVDVSQQEMFSQFWSALSPYGQWMDDPTYGWVWKPSESDFRPYSDGRWEYTSDGWTFIGTEPYGWAVWHYGRWIVLGDGWAWVPGYTWGPAWVTFRSAPDYVGWAPLGPGDIGYDYWVGGVTPWVFVDLGFFGGYVGPSVLIGARPAFFIFERCQPARFTLFHGAHVFHEVPYVHHGPPRFIVRADSPQAHGSASGGTVRMYRADPPTGRFAAAPPSGQAFAVPQLPAGSTGSSPPPSMRSDEAGRWAVVTPHPISPAPRFSAPELRGVPGMPLATGPSSGGHWAMGQPGVHPAPSGAPVHAAPPPVAPHGMAQGSPPAGGGHFAGGAARGGSGHP